MYVCKSWALKRAEHWRLDAFELWCWRRLLRVPLDCMEIKLVNSKGNQSWIFIGRTEAEAGTPIFWPPDANNWLIWKDPSSGKTEGGKRRGQQRMRWLDGITDSMDMTLRVNSRSWWWTGRPGVLQSMGLQRVWYDWVGELNWLDI